MSIRLIAIELFINFYLRRSYLLQITYNIVHNTYGNITLSSKFLFDLQKIYLPWRQRFLYPNNLSNVIYAQTVLGYQFVDKWNSLVLRLQGLYHRVLENRTRHTYTDVAYIDILSALFTKCHLRKTDGSFELNFFCLLIFRISFDEIKVKKEDKKKRERKREREREYFN